MKKPLIFIAILLSTGLISCKKNYLDLSPISSLGTTNFYKNQEQIEQAVTGIYNILLTFPDINFINLSEVRSSNFYTALPAAQRDYYDISSFNVSSSTAILQSAWADEYKMINRANEVLSNINNVTFSDSSSKRQAIGESRFLRGLAYFQLVKTFGGVPLVNRVITASEALKIGRSSVDSIYEFIVQDLTAAVNDLPTSYPDNVKGKATTWAARGILGRVYMTMAGDPLKKTQYFDSARIILKQIIDQEGSYGIQLAPDYKDLFNSDNDNKYFLFEVNYISGGQGLGDAVPGETLPTDISRDIAKYGAYYISGEPSQELLDSYEPGDVREAATISTNYVNGAGETVPQYYFTKFLEPGKDILSHDDWPINFPIIRYADVLLMYAEALNEGATVPPPASVNILNRIRTRAGLGAIHPLTKQDFREAMGKERRHEFAWEGQYWPYLVRTGTALKEMNPWLQQIYSKTITNDRLIYPIPRSEILIYPGLYSQNPGY